MQANGIKIELVTPHYTHRLWDSHREKWSINTQDYDMIWNSRELPELRSIACTKTIFCRGLATAYSIWVGSWMIKVTLSQPHLSKAPSMQIYNGKI